ncbi:alpha-beta hydrolase superfamily lysophospholipase [Labedella gwakjiensis]|uniref:Alpha-beta hydrolase superfamily lysophospholipase n=1 Tax=Labedella gwakjiensis TaxID=390269 RepID=A0A2P8GT35_9MICO|nr:alpha/beta fold hydrolase [Labedella gwakjiensis]PSL37138.1 alpha-beta hydrolase superfamily lysophospholipase [Labedella gwakjiensis]RUQ81960.1 alpha/beta fold hydrolase [Labedella gwakjiensis]
MAARRRDRAGASPIGRRRLTLASGVVVDVADTGPATGTTTGTGEGTARSTGVLLLHGIGMTSASLEPVAVALSASHRAVSLTLPGHGRTPRPSEPLSVEDYATAAGEAADRLGLERVVVVGQSMGAQFSVELARRRPDLVVGLVLIGPVVDDTRRSAVAQGRALALDATRESIGANAIVFRDYVLCGPRWFGSTLRAMLAYPTLEKASAVTVPTVVVRGAGDPIAGSDWVERLAASMGDARVVTIRGAHHAQLVSVRDVAGLVRRVASMAADGRP